MILISGSRVVKVAGLLFLLVLFIALATASPVQAGGVVNDCLTDNDLSNKLVGGGTVTFQCPTSTIPWSGTKTIAANTTIDGDNKITLSGGSGYRLFVVNNGVTLTLRNLTLINGYNPNSAGGAAVSNNGHLILENVTLRNMIDSAYNGGGIATYGALEITNSTFYENKATNGGAIFASGASAVVSVENSTFRNNKATGTTADTNGFGGSIYGMNGATVNLAHSDIHDNSAASGGGIYMANISSVLAISNTRIHNNSASVKGSGILNDAMATLTDVTIDENSGVGTSLGGGIYNYGNLTLTNATLNGNSAYYGAGMSNAFSTANLTNVTVSGNSALAYGGGIDNIAATLYLTNVTLSGNSAGGGGGILNQNIANTNLYLKNVIFANSPTGNNCNFQKAPISSDHSLSSDASCNFGVGSNSAKLKLGPLETNGGLTLTHRLLPGSAAIDKGVFVNTILTDQRAITRPRGTAFEVGAVEFVPCTGTPTKPQRLAPEHDGQVFTQQVLLDWSGPDCVKNFSVLVRQDSKTGPVVFSKSKIKPTQVTTTPLAKNHKYFWQVTACHGTNCITSKWSKFQID